MPETTNTCPKCGNQLEAGAATCPACGTPQAKSGIAGAFQGLVAAVVETMRTHPRHWMIGGGLVGAVAVVAVVMFGGFLGFGDRAICTATLTQAKDFGVISPSADLNSTSAKSTDVKNRRQCSAKVGDEIYTLTVDLKSVDGAKKKCTDLKKQNSCVALYSVVRADGMTTYQVREIPPDQTDEALAAESQQQAQQAPGGPAQGAAPPSTGDAGGLDSETAVDNSGATQGQTGGQAPPQQ